MLKWESKPRLPVGGHWEGRQSPGQGCCGYPEGEEGGAREDGHQWSCRCCSGREKRGLDLPPKTAWGQSEGCELLLTASHSTDVTQIGRGLGWMEAMEDLFGAISGLLGARSDFWPHCWVWRGPLATWVPALRTQHLGMPGSCITIIMTGLPVGWDSLQWCVV